MEEKLLYGFCPGDIILMRSEETGWYRRFKDWLIGSPWGHVALFDDYSGRGVPLIIESIGRGVLRRSLLEYRGRYVKVLRHEDQTKALAAAIKVEDLADDPVARYGYEDIPFAVLPRLILYKVTGKRFRVVYRHNHVFICSEVPDEAYGYVFFPDELEPPLPGDYLTVKELHPIWEGPLPAAPMEWENWSKGRS